MGKSLRTKRMPRSSFQGKDNVILTKLWTCTVRGGNLDKVSQLFQKVPGKRPMKTKTRGRTSFQGTENVLGLFIPWDLGRYPQPHCLSSSTSPWASTPLRRLSSPQATTHCLTDVFSVGIATVHAGGFLEGRVCLGRAS